MTSTGAFIAMVDGINEMVIPIEDINLEEVDYHLDSQEKEAQERYDNLDDEMTQGFGKKEDEAGVDQSHILPGGSRQDTTLAVPVGVYEQ